MVDAPFILKIKFAHDFDFKRGVAEKINALSLWLRANKLSVFPPEFRIQRTLLSNPVTAGDRRAISCPRSRGAFTCAFGGLSPAVLSL
jgi:hypothetical protein